MKMKAAAPVFTSLLLLLACHPKESSLPEKQVISVSILPQKYFIERLAGDLVTVNVLIPPGASHSSYDPTVSQLRGLDASQLYMRIGYVDFELSWMDKFRSVNPSMKVIDMSEGIELIQGVDPADQSHEDHHHSGTDPHIWMSARNAKVIAVNMFEPLCELLPDHRETIKSNLSGFLLELDSLDALISGMLTGKENRNFMIYHPALTYFARDYGLVQLPLELGGKVPSPAHMKRMSDLGHEHQITTIFIQKQFDQRNAQVLAGEIGANIIQIDPLDSDWKNQMVYIAESLRNSL